MSEQEEKSQREQEPLDSREAIFLGVSIVLITGAVIFNELGAPGLALLCIVSLAGVPIWAIIRGWS